MQTITYKIEAQTLAELELVKDRLNLPSVHVAAREMMLSALSASTRTDPSNIGLALAQQEILALRADLMHVIEELRELSAVVRASLRLQAGLSELQLINIADTDPEETQATILALVEGAFEE